MYLLNFAFSFFYFKIRKVKVLLIVPTLKASQLEKDHLEWMQRKAIIVMALVFQMTHLIKGILQFFIN